ncbi:histidine triad nucleotide-binding protein [Glycomyces sp. TRM65418]|uniref:histidine triad nucleotide-binding protein n=1 Tax=Glycomyces sp. TRM65418 TaxID=2867006 RepID=UPI001CE562C0|nr:histidine triad nucleotide-binding protein [Glycomyces sp. TRM65418]MCC3765803.1 histidine triad nucleotide-binding protein [Glycomyces sp. TRM65418]QZD55390.1 histidine triad nucleotide-binding protein [Glycomyces sp. TRM65418]
MIDADCLFCKIAEGAIPSTKVRETERVLAFRDLYPKAPTHVLVIPKDHYANVAELAAADPALAGEVLAVAARVAADDGIQETGWRLFANTGEHGGQDVFHVHFHVAGGKPLGPMLSA